MNGPLSTLGKWGPITPFRLQRTRYLSYPIPSPGPQLLNGSARSCPSSALVGRSLRRGRSATPAPLTPPPPSTPTGVGAAHPPGYTLSSNSLFPPSLTGFSSSSPPAHMPVSPLLISDFKPSCPPPAWTLLLETFPSSKQHPRQHCWCKLMFYAW